MRGKVKHKDKGRKGKVIDSDWLSKAKYEDSVYMDYSNVVAVEWNDGSLGWVNKKLIEEV